MTALTDAYDRINTQIVDPVTIDNLRQINLDLVLGKQYAPHVESFLWGVVDGSGNLPTTEQTLAGSLTALGLGTGASPTFTGLTLSGGMVIDTNTLVVDAVNNRVGLGVLAPLVGLHSALDAQFDGAVTISPTGSLTITNLLSADPSTGLINFGTGLFQVDRANGRVSFGGVGVVADDLEPINQSHVLTSSEAGPAGFAWIEGVAGSRAILGHSRGAAVGGHVALQAGDEMGGVDAMGSDGADFIRGATMVAEVDGSVSSGIVPGRWVFRTRTAAGVITEKLRIDAEGLVSFGGDTNTGVISGGADILIARTGGVEALRLNDLQQMGLGGAPLASAGDGTTAANFPRLQVLGATSARQMIGRFSANANGPAFIGAKSRSGTIGVHALVQNGDVLADFEGQGSDGQDEFFTAGAMQIEVDGTASVSSMPGRIVWYTTKPGFTTPTEAMRLGSNGLLSLAGYTTSGFSAPATDALAITTAGTERVRVDSSGRILVGSPTAIATSSSTSGVQVHSTTAVSSVSTVRWSDDTLATVISMAKSRGAAVGTRGAVQNGDVIGLFSFDVDDGTSFLSAASIRAITEAATTTNSATAYLSFRTANGASSTTERWRITAAGHMQPGADNAYDVGAAGARARVIYAGTGTINTSHAPDKVWLGGMNDNEYAAAMQVLSGLGSYQWRDAVATKGDAARVHFGLKAQDLQRAMITAGIDPETRAMWCQDIVVVDGKPVARQGIRPDQVALWLIAALDRKIKELEAKLNPLPLAA